MPNDPYAGIAEAINDDPYSGIAVAASHEPILSPQLAGQQANDAMSVATNTGLTYGDAVQYISLGGDAGRTSDSIKGTPIVDLRRQAVVRAIAKQSGSEFMTQRQYDAAAEAGQPVNDAIPDWLLDIPQAAYVYASSPAMRSAIESVKGFETYDPTSLMPLAQEMARRLDSAQVDTAAMKNMPSADDLRLQAAALKASSNGADRIIGFYAEGLAKYKEAYDRGLLATAGAAFRDAIKGNEAEEWSLPPVTGAQRWSQVIGGAAGGLAEFGAAMVASGGIRGGIGGGGFKMPGVGAGRMAYLSNAIYNIGTGTIAGNVLGGEIGTDSATFTAFEVGNLAQFIPGPSWAKKLASTIASGVAGGGTAAAQGADARTVTVMALLPAAGHAWGGAIEGVSRLVKRFRPELPTAEAKAVAEKVVAEMPPEAKLPMPAEAVDLARKAATATDKVADMLLDDAVAKIKKAQPDGAAGLSDDVIKTALIDHATDPIVEAKHARAEQIAAERGITKEQALTFIDNELLAVPSSEAPKKADGTSDIGDPVFVKNAYTEARRKELGMETRDPVEIKRDADLVVAAGKRFEQDPEAALLIAAKAKEGQILTDEESVLLGMRGVQLENKFQSAYDAMKAAETAGDIDAIKSAKEAKDFAYKELQAHYEAAEATGTAAGRALRSRQIGLQRDYTLAKVLRDVESANERPATPKEEAKLAKATARIAELEKALKEAQDSAVINDAKASEAELVKAKAELDVIRTGKAPRGGKNRIITDDRLADIKARWKSTSTTLDINQVFGDVVEVALYYTERGVRETAALTKSIVETIGDKAAPYITKAIEAANKRLLETSRENAKAKVKDSLAKGKQLDELGQVARELYRYHMETGVEGREARLEAVWNDLKAIDPKITREQARDAISGYGKSSKPSQEPIEVELRDDMAQHREVAKQRDMSQGKAPLATGPQRDKPSQATRDEIKKTNDAKKEGGYVVTDHDAQLQTTRGAIKTRLENEIADLDKQIQAGKRMARNKSGIEYTPELNALREQRDAKRAILDEIDPPGKPDRTNQRIRALENSIAEYERRIKERDFKAKKKAPGQPDTPEVAALKARRDAKRAELEALKDEANPKPTKEQRQQKQGEKTKAKRIAELQEMLATGNFQKTKPAQRELSKLEIKFQEQLTALKWKIDKARMSQADRFWEGTREVARLGRSVAGGDVSLGMRQTLPGLWNEIGGLLTGRPSMIWLRGVGRGLVAYFNRGKVVSMMEHIKTTLPDAVAFAKKFKLWEELDGSVSQRPESGLSKIAEKAPLVRRGNEAAVAINNNAAVGFYELLSKRWRKAGMLKTEADERELANVIGRLIGRGVLPKGERVRVLADVSRDFLWSPRLWYARLTNVGTLFGTISRNKSVRMEGLRTLAGGVVFLAGVKLLTESLGGSFSLDQDDPEFGQAVFGSVKFDFTGGLKTPARVALRSAASFYHWIMQDGVKPADRGSMITQYVKGQEAPLVGMAWTLWTGKDFYGKDIKGWEGWSEQARQKAMLMFANDAYEVFQQELQENGMTEATFKAAVAGAASWAGVGVQSYRKELPKPVSPKGR